MLKRLQLSVCAIRLSLVTLAVAQKTAFKNQLVRSGLALALCFICISVSVAAPTKMLIVGDSLSAAYRLDTRQGWVALAEQQLRVEHPGFELINGSVSGETSAGGLARLPALLDKHGPDWVLIELGGNDGLRGFPLARLEANLSEMIELAQDAGAEVALMQIRIPPNYGRRYTEGFEKLYPSISDSYDVPLLPFFIEEIALDSELMMDDGIHPNAEAQPLLADDMTDHILELLKH